MQVRFSLQQESGFFQAPFPILHRLQDDGNLRIMDFPNPQENALVERLKQALSTQSAGFGTNSAIFMPFDGPIDTKKLPDTTTSLQSDSPVFLVNIDSNSSEKDQRTPLWLRFKSEAETYSPAHLLVALPRPGFSLRPKTLYALVILDQLTDAQGKTLGSPLALEKLKAESLPETPYAQQLLDGYKALWAHLQRAGIAKEKVRAATVFRTGTPNQSLLQLHQHLSSLPTPKPSALKLLQEFDTYCALEGSVSLPLFQNGERPYLDDGGAIEIDDKGKPKVQASETVRFALTIPKQKMPADGWPLLFYSAGQGGKYTQFIHRGTDAERKAASGKGPAFYLAHDGIAALSIEAPMVGPRHPKQSFEGLDFFNVGNPLAFRDNPRQAAIDFSTLIRMLPQLQLPTSLCPKATSPTQNFQIDTKKLLFYGHSTGASVGSLLLAIEPSISAGLLSGIGGSWLYNLTIKEQPFRFASIVKSALSYDPDDEVDIYDTVLQLAQTLWEPSEPMNAARLWTREPHNNNPSKHILLIEGIRDGYFPPEAVNALAIAARTAPVAPTVEDSLTKALQAIKLQPLPAPASLNFKLPQGSFSTLLVQHLAPKGLDGHYVPFALSPPKYQYRCFFASFIKTGVPKVPTPQDDALAPCP